MHEDLRALLADNGAVAALCGERLSWGTIPQGSADPAVALYEISAAPAYTMDGEDDLTPTRVQIDVRGTTFAQAMTAARAIRAALSGFKGTKGTTQFAGIFQLGGRSAAEKPGDVLYHVVSTDFEVWSKSL